ncbi:MAG: hypothetical protein AB1510_02245 [Bacillota bacterium]
MPHKLPDDLKEMAVNAAEAAGIPRGHAEANPVSSFMRATLGKSMPVRNDCGYPGRFELEDIERMGTKDEGKGMCDHPHECPKWYGVTSDLMPECPIREGLV